MTTQHPIEAPAVRGTRATDYAPIADYGVIGDLNTAALVGLDGSIDWCCFPRFDAPSAFGALLDSTKGGYFQIVPLTEHTTEQRYLPSTNVLLSTFTLADGGVIELIDFMPITASGHRGDFPEIHRLVRCVHGESDVAIHLEPRFDYGSHDSFVEIRRHGIMVTDRDNEVLTLAAPRELAWQLGPSSAEVTIKLHEGEQAWFVLRYDDDEVRPVEAYCPDDRLRETVSFWEGWTAKITYRGEFRDVVIRSALALKGLCYQPTGAIVAAVTTSLPEEIGGIRNWDYRFTWLRDTAFVLYSLHILGHYDEADRFVQFLKRVARHTRGAHLQIMYGIDGKRELNERSLKHLEGYRRSGPVRIGNDAYDQLQLDVYGEVMETMYLWSRHHEMTEGSWITLSRLVDWVAANWRRRDHGIWEVRGGRRHYVFSKVMCWVALDRGVRLAREFTFPADIERWARERDAVHAEVMLKGWNEEKQSFVQSYGSDALDASNLVIPMVRFLPRTHPRVRGTVLATLRELTSDDQEMVYRYRNDDGLPGEEGVFSICTFWLAEALAMIGEIDRAERIFRRMLGHANHLGLFSEELHPRTGQFLGNFPQAFTHIALINCAHVIETLKRRANGAP
jgi:GH15 family glucan-1,4-alpha-glucosidase